MSTNTESNIHNFNELFESGVAEALHQSIFDFFPGIIYVYDAENKKLSYVNKKISEVLGYSSDDLSGWNHDLNKLIFKDDLEAVQKELEKYDGLKNDESHSYDCRLNRKAGDWVHFQITGKIIRRGENGKPSSLLFVAKDISSQLKSDEELKTISTAIKEKEELLADYKEQIDLKEELLECGSWEISFPEKTIFWSDGMYRLFGYDPVLDKGKIVVNEELYSNHMTDVIFKKANQFRDNVMKNESQYTREYEIRTKGGEERMIETSAKLFRDSKGEVIRVLGTTRNITQLRKSEKELEHNIRKLKSSLTDLEDFAHVASHDIQEPLRKITSFSERMKAKFADDLNDEAKNYLDRILNTSKNAHLLIDGLMSFLQLDNHHQLFKKTDLNVLLEEVKGELELKMEETEATIIAGKLPVLEVIPLQVRQLMVNLMLNAFKFRKKETLLVIEIAGKKLTPPEVKRHELESEGDFYEITIKDNGVGFLEAGTEKMFQMFQRFHNKSDYPGAGIGLAICKKIVDKHNGLILAHSVPEQGATFSIILPAKQIKSNESR